ncbi:MAG: glycosyltransferase family 1 protein [Aquiluna sp.]
MEGIWFDGRYINPVKPDGITSFSLGLIRAVLRVHPLTVMVDSQQQAELLPTSENLTLFLTNPVASPKELFSTRKLNREKIRVLFSPMQTTSGLGRNFKLVYTLHDLIYYRHRTPPSNFNPLIRAVWFLYHLSYWPQRRLLNMADAVATVSETTRDQMLKHRLTKKPIYVIHNAAEAPERVDKVNRHDSKILVYMGSFIGYKNVETLVRGMRHLPDHKLVLLSRITESRKVELQALADENGAQVQFENGVTRDEYHEWLHAAKALVSASKDEGFGIPVVEAMERGCPVILSDIRIFEEVAGPAGLRFAAADSIAFAEQVQRLGDKRDWKLHSDLGLSQAEFFTWEDSAELFLELCEELAGS